MWKIVDNISIFLRYVGSLLRKDNYIVIPLSTSLRQNNEFYHIQKYQEWTLSNQNFFSPHNCFLIVDLNKISVFWHTKANRLYACHCILVIRTIVQKQGCEDTDRKLATEANNLASYYLNLNEATVTVEKTLVISTFFSDMLVSDMLFKWHYLASHWIFDVLCHMKKMSTMNSELPENVVLMECRRKHGI